MKTSNDIPAGPFSEQELQEIWNRQANEFNQWDSLDSDEKLAWAQVHAIWITAHWRGLAAVLGGDHERLLKMLKTTDNHHHA